MNKDCKGKCLIYRTQCTQQHPYWASTLPGAIQSNILKTQTIKVRTDCLQIIPLSLLTTDNEFSTAIRTKWRISRLAHKMNTIRCRLNYSELNSQFKLNRIFLVGSLFKMSGKSLPNIYCLILTYL